MHIKLCQRLNGLVKLTFVFVLVFFASMLSVSTTSAQVITAREYQIKALFLFNFTQFVEWPVDAFADPESPLVIGILGEDPFGPYLDEIIYGEKVKDHPLVVRRMHKVEEVGDCHILFINLRKRDELKHALLSLNSQSILTVSDAENFTGNGGMIQFFSEENKIRIRINLEPAREGNLVISSKLLRLSDIDSHNNH